MSARITPHFALGEFGQGSNYGFQPRPYPARWIRTRLTPLCEILEILRAELGGRSITVASGWRSEAYNRAIPPNGGARFSQHVQGRAADIVVRGVSAKRVHATLLRLHREGKILLGGLGAYHGFTHLDVRPSRKTRLARWGGSRRSN